jgi:hypothetical protein
MRRYSAFNASARRAYAAASFAGASGGNVSYRVAAVYGETALPKVAQAAVIKIVVLSKWAWRYSSGLLGGAGTPGGGQCFLEKLCKPKLQP